MLSSPHTPQLSPFYLFPPEEKKGLPSVYLSYTHTMESASHKGKNDCFSAQDRVLLPYPPWAKGKRWENEEVSWKESSLSSLCFLLL